MITPRQQVSIGWPKVRCVFEKRLVTGLGLIAAILILEKRVENHQVLQALFSLNRGFFMFFRGMPAGMLVRSGQNENCLG